jgi:acyl-CoA thioesterase FadM
VLSVDGKRLTVLHHLHRGRDDKLIATGTQTHVHVDTPAGKACAMDDDLYRRFEAMRAAQPAAAAG